MRLVNKQKFSTNVAYVGYFVHNQASRAMKFACFEPELRVDVLQANEEPTTPMASIRHRIRHEGFCKKQVQQEADMNPPTFCPTIQVAWLTTKEQREQVNNLMKVIKPTMLQAT